MVDALVLLRSEALLAEPKLIGSRTLDLTSREIQKQWDSALDSFAAVVYKWVCCEQKIDKNGILLQLSL